MALETVANIRKHTPLGGNVDSDHIRPLLPIVETMVVEPALGTKLYNKIVTDYNDNNPNNLAGDYLTLYNNYIVWIIRYSVYSEYLTDTQILAQNGGVYTHVSEDAQVAEPSNIYRQANKYRSLSDTYISRMNDYLCDKNLPEYDDAQDENYDISPRDISTAAGWHFPNIITEEDRNKATGAGNSQGNFLELE